MENTQNVLSPEELETFVNKEYAEDHSYYCDINGLAGFIKSKWRPEKINSWLDSEMRMELTLIAPDGTRIAVDVSGIDEIKWEDAENL